MTDWSAKKVEPIERRARLNELAATGYDSLSDEEKAEHDELATLVAKDEDTQENGADSGS